MPALTLEAVVAIAGWLCGVMLVFIGWKKIPDWVKNRQAKALSDPKDVARVALSNAVKEDVLPEIRKMVKEEIAAFEVPKPDLAGLQIQIPQESIDSAVKGAMDKIKMERARAGRGDVSSQDLALAQNAATNPEGASMLSGALRAIDALVNNKIIKPATGKDWQRQLREQFATTGDVTDLLATFGIRSEMITNAGGVTVSSRGGPM